MLFSDLFLGVGAMAVAFAVADSVRHYFPNSTRLLTAGLMIFTVDALIPQFSILHLHGVWIGAALATAFGVWYLRRGRVVRQDGTIDNG